MSTLLDRRLVVLGAVALGVAQSASAITYNRTAAIAYANANWHKVVTDGYFWINGSTATKYGAGTAVPVNVTGEASGIGDDCAHFVSSCIGSPGVAAGGLTIPSRAGTYGEPGAARLDELLVGNSSGGYGTTYKYGQLVTSVSQLTPGDVIGYDWTGDGGGSMSGIDHTVIYMGNNQIAAHATSHDGVAWNWSNSASTITFFIHITLADSIVPTAPKNASPASNAVVGSMTPTLTGGTFVDGAAGGKQVAAEWQIFKNGVVVYDTGVDTVHLGSLAVPGGLLVGSAGYTWQVRYEDNYGGWSGYSPSTSFLTVPEPSVVGVVVGGLVLVGRKRAPRTRGG